MTRAKGVHPGADRRNIKYINDVREISKTIFLANRDLMECEVIETALEDIILNHKDYKTSNGTVRWDKVKQAFVDAYWEWVK